MVASPMNTVQEPFTDALPQKGYLPRRNVYQEEAHWNRHLRKRLSGQDGRPERAPRAEGTLLLRCLESHRCITHEKNSHGMILLQKNRGVGGSHISGRTLRIALRIIGDAKHRCQGIGADATFRGAALYN